VFLVNLSLSPFFFILSVCCMLSAFRMIFPLYVSFNVIVCGFS